jgi:hypothetical protein
LYLRLITARLSKHRKSQRVTIAAGVMAEKKRVFLVLDAAIAMNAQRVVVPGDACVRGPGFQLSRE